MKITLQTRLFGGRGQTAFTMIEIALSIAIVAFAMVAIMGVLPTGMTVQKDNREDTIVSSDGQFFIDAIRNGVTNLADLSNNLVWIELKVNGSNTVPPYLYQSSNNFSSRQIIGFMSTPKYEPGTTNILSLRARFLANSGSQALKGASKSDLAFSYLLTSEIVPFANFTNAVSNLYTTNLTADLYELRVALQWPVYGVANTGGREQIFRTLISSHLRKETNSPGDLYFFEPSVYQPVY